MLAHKTQAVNDDRENQRPSNCIKSEKGIYPEATNQGVVGSNPAGRAKQSSLCVTQRLFHLWPVTDLCHHYPQPAERIDDPRTGQDVQPRSAHNAALSPSFPIRPIPATHVMACLAARASSPRYAGYAGAGITSAMPPRRLCRVERITALF